MLLSSRNTFNRMIAKKVVKTGKQKKELPWNKKGTAREPEGRKENRGIKKRKSSESYRYKHQNEKYSFTF